MENNNKSKPEILLHGKSIKVVKKILKKNLNLMYHFLMKKNMLLQQ